MSKNKFSPGDFALRVRRSRTGRGVFAEEPIKKGACIIEYKGRVATQKQLDDPRGKYLFEITKKLTIDGNVPGNTARFINHSCAPNCEADTWKGKVYIFAKRNIKPGEELAYDYGEEYFDMHFKPKGCRCAKCDGRRTLKKK